MIQTIAGVFAFAVVVGILLYGCYLHIRGETCPKCGEHKIEYLEQDMWVCPKCGEYTWL